MQAGPSKRVARYVVEDEVDEDEREELEEDEMMEPRAGPSRRVARFLDIQAEEDEEEEEEEEEEEFEGDEEARRELAQFLTPNDEDIDLDDLSSLPPPCSSLSPHTSALREEAEAQRIAQRYRERATRLHTANANRPAIDAVDAKHDVDPFQGPEQTDHPTWTVPVKVGVEERLVFELITRLIEMVDAKKYTGIYSITGCSKRSGYVVFEADSPEAIKTFCAPMCYVEAHRIQFVPLELRISLLQIPITDVPNGAWVRITRGLYMGDLGYVMHSPDGPAPDDSMDSPRLEYYEVLVVPRFPYHAGTLKLPPTKLKRNVNAGLKAKTMRRPWPHLLKIRRLRALGFEIPDPSRQIVTFKAQRFLAGLCIKRFKRASFYPTFPHSLPEIQPFLDSRNRYRHLTWDHAETLNKTERVVMQPGFAFELRYGDRVEVRHGTLQGTSGHVVHIKDNDIWVRPEGTQDPGDTVCVPSGDVRRLFKVGDSILVKEGPNARRRAYIWSLEHLPELKCIDDETLEHFGVLEVNVVFAASEYRYAVESGLVEREQESERAAAKASTRNHAKAPVSANPQPSPDAYRSSVLRRLPTAIDQPLLITAGPYLGQAAQSKRWTSGGLEVEVLPPCGPTQRMVLQPWEFQRVFHAGDTVLVRGESPPIRHRVLYADDYTRKVILQAGPQDRRFAQERSYDDVDYPVPAGSPTDPEDPLRCGLQVLVKVKELKGYWGMVKNINLLKNKIEVRIDANNQVLECIRADLCMRRADGALVSLEPPQLATPVDDAIDLPNWRKAFTPPLADVPQTPVPTQTSSTPAWNPGSATPGRPELSSSTPSLDPFFNIGSSFSWGAEQSPSASSTALFNSQSSSEHPAPGPSSIPQEEAEDLIDTQSQGAWLLKPEIQRRFEDLTIRVKFRDADLLYGGEFVGMAGETCPASNRHTVVLKPGQVAINAALNRTVPVSVRYLERFPGMAPGTSVLIDGEHCGLFVLVVDDRADGKSMVQDEDGNEHVVESAHLCVAVYPKTGPGPRKTITRKKQPPAPRASRKRKSAARN